MNNYQANKRAMYFAFWVVRNGYYLRYGWRKKRSDKKFTIQQMLEKFLKAQNKSLHTPPQSKQ